jgi:hypothetical protein
MGELKKQQFLEQKKMLAKKEEVNGLDMNRSEIQIYE